MLLNAANCMDSDERHCACITRNAKKALSPKGKQGLRMIGTPEGNRTPIYSSGGCRLIHWATGAIECHFFDSCADIHTTGSDQRQTPRGKLILSKKNGCVNN